MLHGMKYFKCLHDVISYSSPWDENTLIIRDHIRQDVLNPIGKGFCDHSKNDITETRYLVGFIAFDLRDEDNIYVIKIARILLTIKNIKDFSKNFKPNN